VKISEKLQRLSNLKATATKFYKLGKIKKAAKLYQKISGYFNFGDVDQLAENESKESEEYKKAREELNTVNKQCCTNLLVCRYKLKDYGTVTSLADIILESDPKCTKAYFWKGKALFESESYDLAVKAMKKAYLLEPQNEEIKNEYFRIKDGAEKKIAAEKAKYAKLFK